MLVTGTLYLKISDFLNSNMCLCSRLYGIYVLKIMLGQSEAVNYSLHKDLSIHNWFRDKYFKVCNLNFAIRQPTCVSRW